MALARGIVVALTSLAFGIGAVGCGAGTPQAGPSQMAPVTTTSTGSPSGTSPARSTAVTPRDTGSGRCHVADLKADIQVQRDGAAMVMLTNKSSRTCTVAGYLDYRGLLADNSTVAVTTKHVANPGAPVPVTLKSGVSAFSGVKWTSCGKADVNCTVLAGIRVTPPEESTQLTATVIGLDGKPLPQLTVSSAGFTAGSLQPSSQGVVFPA